MSERKPHIIYLLADEHSGQAMSHAGDPNGGADTVTCGATMDVNAVLDWLGA